MNFKLTGLVPLAMLSCIGSAQMHYHLYNISGGGNLKNLYVTDLNNQGQVVGFADNMSNDERSFVWSKDGGIRDLGSGSRGTVGTMQISDSGMIVRDVGYLNNGQIERFIEGTGWVGLGQPTAGTDFSAVRDINASNQIAGFHIGDGPNGYEPITWTEDAGFSVHPQPVEWDNRHWQFHAINDVGMAAGQSTEGFAGTIVWSEGTGFTKISENEDANILTINNSGIVLSGGWYWSLATGKVNLDFNAVDINDLGQIVGHKNGRPILTDLDGNITYLDTMVDQYQVDRGFTFDSVMGITNDGRILGAGVKGQFLAYYEPVPEPATLFLGAAGLLGLLKRKRK